MKLSHLLNPFYTKQDKNLRLLIQIKKESMSLIEDALLMELVRNGNLNSIENHIKVINSIKNRNTETSKRMSRNISSEIIRKHGERRD